MQSCQVHLHTRRAASSSCFNIACPSSMGKLAKVRVARIEAAAAVAATSFCGNNCHSSSGVGKYVWRAAIVDLRAGGRAPSWDTTHTKPQTQPTEPTRPNIRFAIMHKITCRPNQRWANTVFWTEYEYEYYSESEFWPNTNTNNIRFFQNERIRIRIIFVHKYLAEYEYK